MFWSCVGVGGDVSIISVLTDICSFLRVCHCPVVRSREQEYERGATANSVSKTKYKGRVNCKAQYSAARKKREAEDSIFVLLTLALAPKRGLRDTVTA